MTSAPFRRPLVSSLEPLEARIAPAMVTLQIVNPTTATYTDVDGDRVTVKVSAGTLSTGLFAGVAGARGDQLQLLDLHVGGFDGANLTFSVAKVSGGDGLANVGYIDSTAHDLGTVAVVGDLGQIDAGTDSATIPAIKSLTVRSMGWLGRDTQAGGTLQSDITGALGALVVAGDVKDVHLRVVGANGRIGAVTVGGSLIGGPGYNSGEIESTGGIGPVKIGGNIEGGEGNGAGTLFAGGKLGAVTVGGSLLGGPGPYTGQIASNGDLGLVKIGHDVRAGSGGDTGKIKTLGKLAGVTIGGSLIGGGDETSDPLSVGQIHSTGDMGAVKIGHEVRAGSGLASARIATNGKLAGVSIGGSLTGGSKEGSGAIFSQGDMGVVKIGHDVQGGSGIGSARISTNGRLAGVSIGGSLVGGSQDESGAIFSQGDMGAVKIAHDLTGGSIIDTVGSALDSSGAIVSARGIASVTIGGSIVSGTDNSGDALISNASILAGNAIGSLTVKGSLIGHGDTGNGASPIVISARGQDLPLPAGATTDLAIGKINIGGRVEFTNILAGYFGAGALNGSAQIGSVKVGGDWIASNLVAGVTNTGAPANTHFGDGNDAAIGGGTAGIIAKISSITIAGQVFGTPANVSNADHFGFATQQIGTLKIGGHTMALPTNAVPLNVGATADLSVHLLA